MKNVFSQLIHKSLKLSLLCAALSLTPVAMADTMVGFWNFNGNTTNSVTPSEKLTLNNANIDGGTLNAASGYASGTVAALPTGSSPYTISAFLKTTASNSQGIIGWGGYGNSNQVTAFRTNSEKNANGNGFKHYWWGNDYTPDSGFASWGTTVNSGAWNHVVATSSGANQTVYMNGQLLGSQNASGHNATNANFAVGATNSYNEKLNGSIDNASVYSTAMSHTDIINISSSRYNGLANWWSASDYATGADWVDRVSGIVATPTTTVSGGALPTKTETGVEFTSTAPTNVAGPGNYFTTTATNNPIAGLTNYSILVSFTPTSSGTGTTNFYQASGLVGAEQPGNVADWGLGYNSENKLIAGYGNTQANGSDYGLRSTGTVAVNNSAVAGYTINNGDLRVWIDGAQEGQTNRTSVVRNSNVAMYIGRMGADGGYLTGEIHDILLFDRALVSSEMAYYSGMIATDHSYLNVVSTSDIPSVLASVTGKETLWIQETANTQVDLSGSTIPVNPLGVYIGGFTTGANLKVTRAQLDGINRTLVLGGGTLEIVTENTDNGFSKTLDIDGGKVSTTNSLNFANDSRVAIASGSLNVAGSLRLGKSGSGSQVYQNGGTVNVQAWFTMGEGGSSSYTLKGGVLDVYKVNDSSDWRCVVIGDTAGTATFTMSGGTFKTNSAPVQIGKNANATGILNLSGGTITSPEIIVGMTGTGALNYSGGTLKTNKITVNEKGSVYLNNNWNVGVADVENQSLVVNGGLIQSNRVGSGGAYYTNLVIGTGSGSASLTVTNNGVINLMNLASGEFNISAGGNGTATLESGSISARSVNIGQSAGGTGTYTQTGGSATTGYYWSIADQIGSVGKTTLSGGTLSGDVLSVGNRGVGTYNQSGGVARFNSMYLGQSNENATGTVTQTGGKLNIKGTLNLGVQDGNSMTLSGGYASANALTSADKMTWTGGTLAIGQSVSGNLNQQGGTLMVGVPTFESGLNWSRVKLTGLSDGYPGYTSESSGAWTQTTQEANDAFWSKVASRTPQATGVGVIGAGNLESSDPNNYFTLVYKGSIWIENADTYTFNQKADDGGFILLDGETVSHMSTMDRSDPWGQNSINTAVTLEAGWHDFEYRYYEGWGGNSISELKMTNSKGASTNLMDVNSDVLFNYGPEYSDITITGDYTQAKDATLVLEINPITGEYDSITMDGGSLTTNGVLELAIAGDSSQPFEFDVFQALNGADLNFNFDSIQFMDGYTNGVLWNLDGVLAGGDGVLRYAGVPEPTTWALLVLGAGGVFVLRRKLLGARR